jgi:quercetin dioxygenase-like cupin family protein
LIFALYERPDGVEIGDSSRIVYDIDRNEARRGAAGVNGPAIVWAVQEKPGLNEADLAIEVGLDPGLDWLVRCDRVDFPPGGIAYRHVHPGPGIRRLLFGELTIESPEKTHTYRAGEAWFEGAEFPVLATASVTEDTAFVRVLLLPSAWAGKRTIRYLDSADDAKPRLQRAMVLLEEPLAR